MRMPMQPEMSHNVQKYDKNVYLRVSEAQRCRVHSTLMVPVFGSNCRDKALAVFELVQVRRGCRVPGGQAGTAHAPHRSAPNQPAARPSCTPQGDWRLLGAARPSMHVCILACVWRRVCKFMWE